MSTNLKFITGFSGEAHIKPSMDAQWHSASNGKETFVYDYGEKFDLTVNQATSTISIKDGIGQIQGRLFIIEESLIETISYPNVPPEVGLTRIDTVVLHWGTGTRIINGETVTVNTCEFEYKKNPLANGQPETFAETDLNLGDTDAYYPMWHVTWNENGIQEVETIFTVVDKATVGIDTTAPSGTVDGDLYSAIVALDWASDVIEYDMLNQKKVNTKILDPLSQSGTAYCKLPDGTLIQWGHTGISGLTTQVTMPTSFKDNSYTVKVTLIANSNTATNVTVITKGSGDKFSLGVNTLPSGGAEWIAIGKWK